MKNKLSKKTIIGLTDLADELFKSKIYQVNEYITSTDIKLDPDNAKKIGKASGRYITYNSAVVLDFEEDKFDRLSWALKDGLEKIVKGDKILIVGIGNPDLVADSLGSKVVDGVVTSRGLNNVKREVSAIKTDVFAKTGIDSFEIVSGIVDKIKPDCVIIIDSLCAGSVSRLLSSFQMSDTGIVPGSGVGNHRNSIDKNSLKTNVVSIGVPTVVYASTIVGENGATAIKYSENDKIKDVVVTPKDIDFQIGYCAKIISKAINLAMGTVK